MFNKLENQTISSNSTLQKSSLGKVMFWGLHVPRHTKNRLCINVGIVE